jgi:hypothetical protein
VAGAAEGLEEGAGAGAGAGVEGEAVLAVAEECRAGEAPAVHGNDSQTTAAIN